MLNSIIASLILPLLLSSGTVALPICSDVQIKVSTTAVPEQSPKRFVRAIAVAKPREENIDLLIAGDSIAAHWGKYQERDFSGHIVHNFGVGGDKTQELLWRVQKMAPPISPKNVVVIIGTNNMRDTSTTACGAAAGIVSNAKAISEKWPNARIHILPVLPRGKDFKFRNKVRIKINELLQMHTVNEERISILSVDEASLTCKGHWPCQNYLPDALHISSNGYRLLRETVRSAIEDRR